MTYTRVLLPVSESATLRRTVAEAVYRAIEEPGSVEFTVVYVPSLRTTREDRSAELEAAEALLDRVEAWIETDAGEESERVRTEGHVVGVDANLYSPLDVAHVLVDEIRSTQADTVVFDPGYDPGGGVNVLNPIERVIRESTDATVVVPSVEPVVRRPRFPRRADLRRYGFVFAISFVFYLILAGGVTAFELVTGAITASIVTATLGAISLWQPPAYRYTPARAARAVVYIPYLLVMIAQSNISVARVILDPRLRIEPRVVRYHPAVFGPFPITTLANSITLTPGTLSMRVVDQELLVHTLTRSAREDLVDGRLERAVRFLFFGRKSTRIPSPLEREDVEVIEPPEGPR
ncbi:MAG: monovalent cation/H+ antiporter subunit E [Halobacteriota archaeon]